MNISKQSQSTDSNINSCQSQTLTELLQSLTAQYTNLTKEKESLKLLIGQGKLKKEEGLNEITTIDDKIIEILEEINNIQRKRNSPIEAINEGLKKFTKALGDNDIQNYDIGADISSLRVIPLSMIPIFIFEKYQIKIFEDEVFLNKILELSMSYKESLTCKYSKLLSKEKSPAKSSIQSLIKLINNFNQDIVSKLGSSTKHTDLNNHNLSNTSKELYEQFKIILDGISKHNRDSYGRAIETLFEEQRSKLFSTLVDSKGNESFLSEELKLELDETSKYIKEVKIPFLLNDLTTTIGIIKEDHLQDIKQTKQTFVSSSLEKVLNWLFENPYFLCLYINKKLSKLKNNGGLKQNPMLPDELEQRIDTILAVGTKEKKQNLGKSESDKYYSWIRSILAPNNNTDKKANNNICDYTLSTLNILESKKGDPKITKILRDLYLQKDKLRVPKTLEYLDSHKVALYIADLEYRKDAPISMIVKYKSPLRLAEKIARRYLKQIEVLRDNPTPQELISMELYDDEFKRNREYLVIKDIVGIMFVYPPTSIDLTKDENSIKYLSLSNPIDKNKRLKQNKGKNFYKNPKGGFVAGIKKRCRPIVNPFYYFNGQLDYIEIMLTDLIGLIDSEIGSRAHNLYEAKESRFIEHLKGMDLNTYNYLLKISTAIFSPYWNELVKNPINSFFLK